MNAEEMSMTITRVVAVLGLFCLGFCYAVPHTILFEHTIAVHEGHVILDHQPLKNNSLVYAGCSTPHERESFSCSVILLFYQNGKNYTRKACDVHHRAAKDSYIMQDFQLKSLFSDYVIFMWTERLIKEDEKNPVRQLVYRTLEMSSCKFIEKKIDYVAYSRPANVDDFYVVPYQDTFDLYFMNETLCGDKMCGLTQNKRGKIINGPVATYLPSEHFRYETSLYPVRPTSAAWGLFVLSKQLRLVSSNAGEIKFLMDYPTGLQGQAFSCNNGYLGTCWLPSFYTSPLRNNKNLLNCKQFDSHGNQIMDFTLAQEYLNFDSYIAVSNMRDGGMLILTTSCREHCRNKDTMIFDVYKIRNNEIKRIIRSFKEVPSDGATLNNVRAEIFEKDNGEVCWSIFHEKVTSTMNLVLRSGCTNYREADLDNQEVICTTENCLPKMFTQLKNL